MKKNLPSHDIANELSGSSVFFSPKEKTDLTQQPEVRTEPDATTNQPIEAATVSEKPHSVKSTPSNNHDTVIPRNHDTKKSGKQSQAKPRTHQTTTQITTPVDVSPDKLEGIRKVVKQLGKEAATHRFTIEEKRAVADLVYTYNRQGYRTSENEITRIAVNWLLLDFKERGEQSVLSRMLELLHG